jgi:CheY-like chemotaxis protein
MSNTVREVLLVEPEPVVAEVTAFRLELLGYRVICVDSAEAALTKIGESAPDLVITDLVLPAMDGMAFIERLMTDKETSGLRIMVLSIDADLSKVQAAYNAGARDFIVVPFHPEVLEDKVSKLLASAPVQTRAAKAKATAAAPVMAEPLTVNS